MEHAITSVERAFQLAQSSTCVSVTDIKKQLAAEGYSTAQITGRTLSTQLKAIITARRD